VLFLIPVAIPSNISDALAIAKKASHWMFGSFFVGLSFSVVGFIAGSFFSPPPPSPVPGSWLEARLE
jgi:hypothetical protein